MYSQNSSFTVPQSSKASSEVIKKRWYQKWWLRLIIIFLTIFFILLIAASFYIVRIVILLRSGQLTPQQLFGEDFASSRGGDFAALVTTDDPSLGPRDAKVVIIEFSDFQCQFCQQVQPVVKEILKDYGDKILFIYRDFPLVADHPDALLAALAGECAHEQGKFWEMHDKIFSSQDEINEANLKTYAVQIGLNSIQFGNCIVSGKYLKEIEEDLTQGYAAGVRATPTFFINGVRVPGAIPLATFEQIIISELSR
jgi:protein-disulfide isomerase